MESRRLRRRWTPLLVLVVGLACTAAACWQVARSRRASEQERFASSMVQTRAHLMQHLNNSITILRGTAGFFSASEYVSASEFRRYVQPLQLETAFPGILGIGYSARSDASELLNRIRRELGGDYSLRPPGDRPEHHAIVYLEPLNERNQAAIGFDMFSEEVRRRAMEKARDGGEPAASGIVTLLQETDPTNVQYGFLIYVPVYAAGEIPVTEAARRELLSGFVYSPLRIRDFIGAVFGASTPPAEFALYDAERLLYASPGFDYPGDANGDPQQTSESVIQVADRLWIGRFAPGASFLAMQPPNLAPFAGITGGLISLLLFLVVREQARSAERSEHAADELRASQRGLQHSEARKGAMLASALDAIITIDHTGRIVEWNPAATRIFGWPRGEAMGAALQDLILPDRVRGIIGESLMTFLRERDGEFVGNRIETTGRRADGTEFPVEVSISRIGSAEPVHYTGFVRDITERVRAREHQQLLTRELDHRVKNNLATVLAILAESARRAPSVEDVVKSVNGRIRALAGLHEMLAARKWGGAEIRALVERILDPYHTIARAGLAERVRAVGEPLTLPDKAAAALCMALHELATNASKYGALSVPGGSIEVRWRPEQDPALGPVAVITWTERGGPPVTPPAQRGFGSELIEAGIAFETGGSSMLEFAPEGLVCAITIPISQPPGQPSADSDLEVTSAATPRPS